MATYKAEFLHHHYARRPAAALVDGLAARRAAGVTALLVDRLDVAVYRLPTDRPEADGMLTWDATTAVVVQAHGGGRVGTGWTYADASTAHVVRGLLSDVVIGRPDWRSRRTACPTCTRSWPW